MLAYRDTIVPRSEASFLRRSYIGFQRLRPVWIGTRRVEGVDDLGAEPLILGRHGPLGVLDRFLFKQFGVLPPQPDLAALRPRLIHAHFGRGGALALPIARALGIPLVVTYHGGDATKETHYRRRLLPTIYQRRLAALQREAAAFVCVSGHIRDRLIERGFPEAKLHVLRYGVELGELPAGFPGSGPILFVGRFVEKKGVTHLIEAVRRLESEGATVPLVLIGDGPLAPALKEQARALRNATFLGWQPRDAVLRHMRAALAVCVPSVTAASGDTEGLPSVVLEAMAEGTPVIGTRHAGIGEAIADGRSGLLVASGDAAALAAAIRRMHDDPAARQAMGAAARERVEACFDAMRQSQRLEELLLACAGS
jgi:colanic acid/amylovoran biosynthesis glycosyltransferase